MASAKHEFYLTLREMRRLYFKHPHGLRDSEIAVLLKQPYLKVWRYRQKLTVFETEPGRFTAAPSPEEVDFARAILWRYDYDRPDRTP